MAPLKSTDPGKSGLFGFTVDSNLNAGDQLNLTFKLEDGATVLPSITVPVVLSREEPLRETFDSPVAPNLPFGWTTGVVVGQPGDFPWVAVTVPSETLPNRVKASGPGHVADIVLTTPSFFISNDEAKLSFENSYNFENGFDGGVLEVSVEGARLSMF